MNLQTNCLIKYVDLPISISNHSVSMGKEFWDFVHNILDIDCTYVLLVNHDNMILTIDHEMMDPIVYTVQEYHDWASIFGCSRREMNLKLQLEIAVLHSDFIRSLYDKHGLVFGNREGLDLPLGDRKQKIVLAYYQI